MTEHFQTPKLLPRNWTWNQSKSSACSWPPSHLSRPGKYILQRKKMNLSISGLLLLGKCLLLFQVHCFLQTTYFAYIYTSLYCTMHILKYFLLFWTGVLTPDIRKHWLLSQMIQIQYLFTTLYNSSSEELANFSF